MRNKRYCAKYRAVRAREAIVRHCALSRADRSNQCFVRFFKMAAILHLGFLSLKVYLPIPFGGPISLTCAKFRADRAKRYGDMAIFRFFQDGGRPSSWIFKSSKF